MNRWFACVLVAVSGVRVFGQVGDPDATPALPPGPASFSCQDRPPGYYADAETGCRTYHVCDGNSHFTYVCPPRTLFRQKMRICDHSYLVDCEESGPTGDVRVRPPSTAATPATDIPTEPPPTTTEPQPTASREVEDKFLRINLKDFRFLFYIPEVNNSIAEQERPKELVLAVGGHEMKFKSRGEAGGPCPGRCDPRYLLPGTCHPCLVIK